MLWGQVGFAGEWLYIMLMGYIYEDWMGGGLELLFEDKFINRRCGVLTL